MKNITEKSSTLDKIIQVRVSGNDLERVKRISDKMGIAMSAVVRVILKRWLSEHKQNIL